MKKKIFKFSSLTVLGFFFIITNIIATVCLMINVSTSQIILEILIGLLFVNVLSFVLIRQLIDLKKIMFAIMILFIPLLQIFRLTTINWVDDINIIVGIIFLIISIILILGASISAIITNKNIQNNIATFDQSKGNKFLYQPDKTSSLLAILYLVTNVIATIFLLNNVVTDVNVSIIVLGNIFLSFLGFIIATQLKRFVQMFAIVAIITGIIQIIRVYLFIPLEVDTEAYYIVLTTLATSGIFMILAGFLSYFNISLRNNAKALTVGEV